MAIIHIKYCLRYEITLAQLFSIFASCDNCFSLSLEIDGIEELSTQSKTDDLYLILTCRRGEDTNVVD
jgi:hypothetical protein